MRGGEGGREEGEVRFSGGGVGGEGPHVSNDCGIV